MAVYLSKIKTLLIFLGDIFVFYAALALTIAFRYNFSDFPDLFFGHFVPFTIILLIWILNFFIGDFYQLRKIFSGINFYTRASKIILLNILIAAVFFYFIPYFKITPKTNLLIFSLIFIPLFFFWKYLFQKMIAKNGGQKLLFIGEDEEYRELINYLKNHPQLGYRAKSHLRFFDDGKIAEADALIREEKIDTVIIPNQLKKNQALINYFFKNSHLNINVVDIPSFSEEMLLKIPIFSLEESWFLENLLSNRKLVFEKIKRLFDVFTASFLAIFTALIFPLIALAIKIESSGPVFYRQKRVGKNGKIFEMVKFRSMYAKSKDGGAENGKAVWANENDPRVTKIGNILRKTRIDEIPQIINILKGEMSLIGPRPERPEFEAELSEKIPYYNMRHLIFPGLTGWAQINYPYGASIEDAKEKLEYDLYYLKNRSLILDVVIILKTARIIISREGR